MTVISERERDAVREQWESEREREMQSENSGSQRERDAVREQWELESRQVNCVRPVRAKSKLG